MNDRRRRDLARAIPAACLVLFIATSGTPDEPAAGDKAPPPSMPDKTATPTDRQVPDPLKRFDEKQYYFQRHGVKDLRTTIPLNFAPDLVKLVPNAKAVLLFKAPHTAAVKLEGIPSEGIPLELKASILREVRTWTWIWSPSKPFVDLAADLSFTAGQDGDLTRMIGRGEGKDAGYELTVWCDRELRKVKWVTRQGARSEVMLFKQEAMDGEYCDTEVRFEGPRGEVRQTCEYEKQDGVWLIKSCCIHIPLPDARPPTVGKIQIHATHVINKGIDDKEIEEAHKAEDLLLEAGGKQHLPDQQGPTSGAPPGGVGKVEDRDQAVLDALRQAGSDLSKEHGIEFCLMLPNEAAARDAARQLTARDFSTRVDVSDDGRVWICEATRWMVPELSEIRRTARSLQSLAESLKGEYDGWGTQIVK